LSDEGEMATLGLGEGEAEGVCGLAIEFSLLAAPSAIAPDLSLITPNALAPDRHRNERTSAVLFMAVKI